MFIYVLIENVSQRYIFETVSLSKMTLGLFGWATFSLFSAVEQCFPLTIIQPWNSIFSAFQLKRTGRLNLDPEGVCTTGSFSSNAVQAQIPYASVSSPASCPLPLVIRFSVVKHGDEYRTHGSEGKQALQGPRLNLWGHARGRHGEVIAQQTPEMIIRQEI